MVRSLNIQVGLRSSDKHYLGLASFAHTQELPVNSDLGFSFPGWGRFSVHLPSALPLKWLLGLCHSPVMSFPVSHLLLLQTRLSGWFLVFTTSSGVELLMEHSAQPVMVGLSWFLVPCAVVCSCYFLTQKTELDFGSSSPTRMSVCNIKHKSNGFSCTQWNSGEERTCPEWHVIF